MIDKEKWKVHTYFILVFFYDVWMESIVSVMYCEQKSIGKCCCCQREKEAEEEEEEEWNISITEVS